MSSTIQKYVIPGLETLGGAASQLFAPGNPIGIGMMGNGVGQLAGGAGGGNSGQALGGGLGGLLGGLGGMMGGGTALPTGFTPTPSGAPPGVAQAMQQNPALAGINPNMVTAMSGGPMNGTPQIPGMGGQQGRMMNQTMAALGPVGASYMKYLQDKKLAQMNRWSPAPGHSTPMSTIPGLSMAPPMGGFALPQIR